MSVIDSKQVLNYLTSWMNDYFKSAGKDNCIIYYLDDEKIESSLLNFIMSRNSITCTMCHIKDNYDLIDLVKLSKSTNGLIVSSINRNKYRLIRSYPKFFNPDLMPLADLYCSENAELLSTFETVDIDKVLSSILSSDDLEVSLRDLEWADREDAICKIISSNVDPTTHWQWVTYNMHQKRLLANMHQQEKLTKHKCNPNHSFVLRNTIPGIKT